MRIFRSGALLALLLLLAAPAAPAQEAEADPDVAAMSRVVDELVKEVEEVRGLRFKTEFARELFTPEELKVKALEMLDKELPPEKRKRIAALDARLGFYPPGTDIGEVVTEFLGEGVAGFYDPIEKKLSVQRGFSPKGARPVILHELIHALEDQHFDLGALDEEFSEVTDRSLGLAGVVEGSATHFMMVWMSRNFGAAMEMMRDFEKQEEAQAELMNRVPVVLSVHIGLYPYLSGMTFVQRITGGDPAKISELYSDLPFSSEQVLHPSKYRKDFPYRVSLLDLSPIMGEGWSMEHEDILGELSIAVLLNEFEGGTNEQKLARVQGGLFGPGLAFRGTPKLASEGWDGDRVQGYFGPGGAVGFVWASRWDSVRDAREFAQAYEAGFEYKRRMVDLPLAEPRIEVRGDRVLIVEGLPAEKLEEIAAAAWDGAAFVPNRRDEEDVRALEDRVKKR
jgi:hypothetical protein